MNSVETQGNSVEIRTKLFIHFHSFSQVRNTFYFWGNLIPLISPVATVKTGENSCEKKWKGIHRTGNMNSLSFHFPFPPTGFNLSSNSRPSLLIDTTFLAHPAFRPKMSLCHHHDHVASVVCPQFTRNASPSIMNSYLILILFVLFERARACAINFLTDYRICYYLLIKT